MSKVILEAKQVTKIFDQGKTGELVANKEVSLQLHRGEILGVVGESGSGKSTLAKLLMSLETPTSGEIVMDGKNILNLSKEELRQSRRSLQMVFQDPAESINPKMKIKDIICEPLRNFGLITRKEVSQKAVELLEMVELGPEYAERYPHGMSGGQRQRVGIARALALSPQVVILDEATSALDVSVQKNIIDLIRNIQKEKGLSFLFICHDIALIRSIADRIMVMHQGEVVEELGKEKILKKNLHPYTKTLFDSVFAVHPNSCAICNSEMSDIIA